MTEAEKSKLALFGFRFDRGGAHMSRTMMLVELNSLLAYVDRADATKPDYLQAVDVENCLGKRSGKTRILTYRHLVDLYRLDPSFLLFRAMHFFWKRDESGRPLIALLCVYTQDSLFRSSAPFMLPITEGTVVPRTSLEEFVDAFEPGRFSMATLKSIAQNINSTWTKTGHLQGRAVKVRTKPSPTTGSVAYALLLGYLTGARGQMLFQTEYMNLLECQPGQALTLAEEASRKSWLVMKRVGDVIEVQFPNLLNEQEKERVRE